MPTAHQVATGLRKLADSLDQGPDLNIQPAWVSFYCDTKEMFLNTASLLPKPYTKRDTDTDGRWSRIKLEHKDGIVDTAVSVLKSLTCELVEPAKPAVYRCDPILSALEEAAL